MREPEGEAEDEPSSTTPPLSPCWDIYLSYAYGVSRSWMGDWAMALFFTAPVLLAGALLFLRDEIKKRRR